MKFFFTVLFDKKKKQQKAHAILSLDESSHNITEGSEFLDDAIRMYDQSFMYEKTEESISAGSPREGW